MSECCQEIKSLRMFLAEIGFNISSPTYFLCDNVAAQAWANNSRARKKAKQIDIRYHFIRNCVQGEIVVSEDVNSVENPADLFTKPLDRLKFVQF